MPALLACWLLLWSVLPVNATSPRTAYVSNFDSDTVAVVRLASDGGATVVDRVAIAAGSQPLAGAITPDGTRLYFANFGGDGVSAFAIGADGSPVPLGTFAPTATIQLANASGIAVDPTGAYLYVSYFNGGKAGHVVAFAIAADGSLTLIGEPLPTGGDGAAGIALTPDGRFLYAANMGSGTVSGFAVGGDGGLRPVGSPTLSDQGAFHLGMAPAGGALYVANATADTITAFAIGDDGALTRIGGPVPAGGPSPRGVLVAPDGRTLYVAHYNTGHNGSLPGSVAAFRIAADGSPAPLGEAISTGGNGAEALALTPDGRTLYVANFGSSTIAAFAVAADGSLTPRGEPLASGGTHPDFQAIVVAPNQAPTAAFSVAAGEGPAMVAFDATASADIDGAVARYDWDFGDGTVRLDAGPTPVHAYAAPGAYAVTLTVTDDEGCSTRLVYTGQSVSCNGGPGAAATRVVTIPPDATPAP